MSATDVLADAMRQAITLSKQGLGWTSPNPIVGCVVLDRTGSVAGTGYHRQAGGPHAEVVALAPAGQRAREGTAVVTLEPCAHTGRTGPCVFALRAAGVAKVAYAVPDPNPMAAGGAAWLRAAGIEVVDEVLRAEAERANEMWLTAVRLGRPYVTWKFAGTIDGHSAATDGSARWITGEQARRDAHSLRATHDAVLVGAGTVRADDPHLGLRHGVHGKPPIRVVLISDGTLPPAARVLDHSAATVVAMDSAAPAPDLAGAELLPLPKSDRGPSVQALLTTLYARGMRSVLLEGGARLAATFVAAGLVDRIVAYLAPALLGAGRPVLDDIGVTGVDHARRLTTQSVDQLGDDIRVVLRPLSDMTTPEVIGE